MKDRYDKDILVGDKARVGLGGTLLYPVVRLEAGLVVLLDSKGEEFTREPKSVSVCLRERKDRNLEREQKRRDANKTKWERRKARWAKMKREMWEKRKK